MHAHFFQHVPFEGLGSIGPWLEARRAVVTATRFFEDAVLPEAEGLDLLIVMGGPMSVNDEELHPWLIAEKRFIAQAIRRGKAVLGVCLGAQLIAAALGRPGLPERGKGDRLVPRLFPARSRRGPGGRGSILSLPGGVARLPLARGDVRPAHRRRSPGAERGVPEPGVSVRTEGRRAAVSPRDDPADGSRTRRRRPR